MKKLFILTSVLALGALGAMAQGEINGANNGQGSLIYIGTTSTQQTTKIGTPATAAGYQGAGPGAVAVSIYASPSGTSLSALESSTPIWTGFNSSSPVGTFAGTAGLNPIILPTQTGYDGSATLEFIVYAQTTGGGYSAWSSETSLIPAVNGAPSVPAIFGSSGGLIGSFTLVPSPEPSTLALGGLGAAALLMFRRRK